MGWIDRISEYLEPSSCMHAVGQGALGKSSYFLFSFILFGVCNIFYIIFCKYFKLPKNFFRFFI